MPHTSSSSCASWPWTRLFCLRALAEEAANPNGAAGDCTFDAADLDEARAQLDEAVALANPGVINIFIFNWSFGKPLDQDLFEQFLSLVDEYVDSGAAQSRTMPELIDAQKAWEN